MHTVPAPRLHGARALSRQLAMLVIAALLAVMPLPAGAQGTLRGVVIDSASREPVASADVSIISLHIVARADDHGRFSLTKLPAGPVELSVRRLGYQPQRETILLTGGNALGGGVDSVLVALVPQPEVLSAIAVSSSERRRREWVEDFYVRRARGIGVFVTREDLEARNARVPTDVLNLPGISVLHTRYGTTVRFAGTSSARRDCAPNLWLDGQRAANLDLDDIPVNDIEGIELYHGPSTTPAQFWQGGLSNTACGTIVVWSRIPGE